MRLSQFWGAQAASFYVSAACRDEEMALLGTRAQNIFSRVADNCRLGALLPSAGKRAGCVRYPLRRTRLALPVLAPSKQARAKAHAIRVRFARRALHRNAGT
jgi:hypothetical protein